MYREFNPRRPRGRLASVRGESAFNPLARKGLSGKHAALLLRGATDKQVLVRPRITHETLVVSLEVADCPATQISLGGSRAASTSFSMRIAAMRCVNAPLPSEFIALLTFHNRSFVFVLGIQICKQIGVCCPGLIRYSPSLTVARRLLLGDLNPELFIPRYRHSSYRRQP